MNKEATVKDIMAAAAPLAGLDPTSERFVAGNLAGGALHAAFLPETLKVWCGGASLVMAACLGRTLLCSLFEGLCQAQHALLYALLLAYAAYGPGEQDRAPGAVARAKAQ